MVDITDEIIQKLKDSQFSIPVNDVREQFSTKTPTYPMIVVVPLDNNTRLQLHGEEIRSNISFTFEIYARDMSYDGSIYTKSQVATIIGNELDKVIRETYGLRRTRDPRLLPYSKDGSIIRRILTYSGIIDNRTMIIYQ